MADTVSRSWFAVFPNPEQHGYEGSPEDIIEKLKQEWIGSNPLRKGWWGYCISEKGLPHTFTTRLCESGINIKVIQSVLGHSDISTTLDIYADVTKDLKKAEMQSFEDFLKKKDA